MSLEKHRREDKTQEQTVCNYFPPVLSQPSMKPISFLGSCPKKWTHLSPSLTKNSTALLTNLTSYNFTECPLVLRLGEKEKKEMRNNLWSCSLRKTDETILVKIKLNTISPQRNKSLKLDKWEYFKSLLLPQNSNRELSLCILYALQILQK